MDESSPTRIFAEKGAGFCSGQLFSYVLILSEAITNRLKLLICGFISVWRYVGKCHDDVYFP